MNRGLTPNQMKPVVKIFKFEMIHWNKWHVFPNFRALQGTTVSVRGDISFETQVQHLCKYFHTKYKPFTLTIGL